MVTAESGSFGVLLRQLRLAAGLTQEDLAERAGISAKAVSGLERDPDRSPRLDTVALLADALGLDSAGRARLLAAARPAPVPPAPSLPVENATPTLPRPLTPLFGRSGVAAAVTDLLRRGDVQLLTLTGPGGVGKTRLAIAVAERLEDDFADGAVFVDLAPLRDPELVLAAIAQRLAIDERDRTPLAERLSASLRRKHLLLLLDNIEHLLAARETVVTLLEACPRLAVLATSRVPLQVRGEREYRVAPLELPDAGAPPEELARSPAVALFLDRARAVGADLAIAEATPPAAAEICRRLDGLPLAIELAAAWTRLMPPPELLAKLNRRLPLLVGGPHDLPARQRTMRDAIGWSYDLLDGRQQRLFRRLCVFTGGCTLEAAEAVAAGKRGNDGQGESEILSPFVLDDLAALVDRNLIRAQSEDRPGVAESRLSMLETLREYGLEQLEESGEAEDVRRVHATYYLALAEAAERQLAGPRGAVWGQRLEAEHDNVRAALAWLLVAGDARASLRLAGALWRFWSQRGHLSEGRQWLRDVLELADRAGTSDASHLAKALIGAAHLSIEQGAFDDAAPLCERAVALARGQRTPAILVAALNAQGLLARERGTYQEATRRHEEALALARTHGDRTGLAAALTGLSYATGFAGDIPGGIAFSEQAMDALREVGDKHALAAALGVMTAHLTHAGDFARAEPVGTEALALYRLLGDTGQEAGILFGLGILAQFQEQYERAAVLHGEALTLRRKRGDEHGTIESLSALALIALRQGDYQSARVLLEEALKLLEQYDDRWARSMSLAILGHVDLATGKVAVAAGHFAESALLMQDIGNPLHMPSCLEGLAGVAAARGEWELAARLCGAHAALHERLGLGMPLANPTGHARSLAETRAALGENRFVGAHAAGMALAPDEAFAEASATLLGESR
jgi:predicted ATPase/transcriptional regulator with XRE-family HTH domain